jgi:hypothetical protein
MNRYALSAGLLILVCLAQAGCGTNSSHPGSAQPTPDSGAPGADSGLPDATMPPDDSGSMMMLGGGDAIAPTGDASAPFDVEPSTLQTITVPLGQAMPPAVMFTATQGGESVPVAWGVDRGNIGTIAPGPSSSASFLPTGTTGGLVDVIATYGSQTIQRQVLVQLTGQQNGVNANNVAEQGQTPTTVGQLQAGGGVGGVGGEGLGVSVTDAPTLAALTSPSSNGQGQQLAFLYPYNNTVWPRGMLAPLLMWSWATNDADAIQIKLSTTSGSFTWSGVFGRPAILSQTMGPFIRHPIPQDVWDIATNTAGGLTPSGMPDQLTVQLTIAKAGLGYGPLSETWTVAPARLTGTVYYNSYGTQLVKNWVSTDQAGNTVGAAILSVRSGDTGPSLVVGQNSPTNAQGVPTDDSGCRVCHVVSSRGRWLITQSEQGTPGDGQSYLYDLTAPNVQGSSVTLMQQGTFTWAAMVGDGSYALTNAIDPSSSNPGVTNSAAGTATSSFWQFGASPQPATFTGLPAGVAAGYPSYSPDDKYIAYIDVTGATNNVDGPLMVGTYSNTTQTFANLQNLASPVSGQRIGYPVFLPDDSAVLFETEVRPSQSDKVMVTRNGARSNLWWLSPGAASPMPTALATLNGTGYLPIGPNNHGIAGATDPQSSYNETGFDDTTLNYEPTVLPIAEGGYAWVVFTSRRMYGNELTSVPWQSWPPSYNTTKLSEATVKKLWVAAIDLNAPPGSDPSHPAFYLPAQEILAGNSRGFWVLDPCEPDGQSCQSGDQCCNGYCEANGDGGALICSNTTPTCAAVQDKCTTAASCCDSTNLCVNGFCAPQQSN